MARTAVDDGSLQDVSGRVSGLPAITVRKGGGAKFNVVANPDGSGAADEVSIDTSLAKLRAGVLEKNALPAPTGEWTLNLTENAMDDLWLVVAWGAATT